MGEVATITPAHSTTLSRYRAKLATEGLSPKEIAEYLTLCALARAIEEMKGTIKIPEVPQE